MHRLNVHFAQCRAACWLRDALRPMTVFGMESRRPQCSSVAGFDPQHIASALPASSKEGRATIPAPYLTGRHATRAHCVRCVQIGLELLETDLVHNPEDRLSPEKGIWDGCVQWAPGRLVHKNQEPESVPQERTNEHSPSDITLFLVKSSPSPGG